MTQAVKQNNNQEISNHLKENSLIRPGIKDITARFHPANSKEFSQAEDITSYMEAINRNNHSFNTCRKNSGNAANGGIIVFTSDYQNLFGPEYISAAITNYTHKMKLEGISCQVGKEFLGSYTENGVVFDASSFTADIGGADSNTLSNLAAALAYNFQQQQVVVRDFNSNKTYLINGIK